jgi:hypothetical protein
MPNSLLSVNKDLYGDTNTGQLKLSYRPKKTAYHPYITEEIMERLRPGSSSWMSPITGLDNLKRRKILFLPGLEILTSRLSSPQSVNIPDALLSALKYSTIYSF